MNSRTTREFRELFAALPAHVKRQARHAYRLFYRNPHHPGLHFKQVRTEPRLFSARVGMGFRAVCVLNRDRAIWFWIGSHSDYNRLLKRL
ncbi:MAG TPA: hypothetical protein PLZ55_05245 [bacterium]|nr:hypothetical protein [bacterium]HPO08052.1 hypothetical protein [bacterium]HQP97084.1 hypothetical protein [bacterium]